MRAITGKISLRSLGDNCPDLTVVEIIQIVSRLPPAIGKEEHFLSARDLNESIHIEYISLSVREWHEQHSLETQAEKFMDIMQELNQDRTHTLKI